MEGSFVVSVSADLGRQSFSIARDNYNAGSSVGTKTTFLKGLINFGFTREQEQEFESFLV